MYRLTQSKIEDIAPKRAEQLLKLNNFEGQRPTSNGHIQNLVSAIRSGSFRIGSTAFARKTFNGSAEVLVNGQHQLHACITAGKPIRVLVER
jgi:hypothetical protein